MIRRFPNGATQCIEDALPYLRGERRELKHLSSGRKRKQTSDSLSSGERTGKSPNQEVYGPSGVIGLRYCKIETSVSRWKYAAERVRPPFAKLIEA